jgi:hypothetical protein
MNSIRLCQERKVGLKPWVMREEEGAKPRKKKQAEKKSEVGMEKKMAMRRGQQETRLSRQGICHVTAQGYEGWGLQRGMETSSRGIAGARTTILEETSRLLLLERNLPLESIST